MSKFTDAWKDSQERVLTENGAVTFNTSARSTVDLFFTIGALRGQGVDKLYNTFAKAFGENPYIATRILLWARDVRGGAGERQIFRDLLLWLERMDKDVLKLILPKVPELGRWDDLLVFKTAEFKTLAFEMIDAGLRNDKTSGLCAKWLPREGNKKYAIVRNELRKHLGLTPKQYRQVLSKLSNTVETAMCSNDWTSINYEHVPSLAQARYSKAFLKHDETRYRKFGEAAVKGVDENGKEVKINAGAVYPYDVIKTLVSGSGYYATPNTNSGDLNVIRAQWAALPNFVGSKNILPMVDMSGSMWQVVSGTLQVIDVAVSLGLYMASKNTGDYHNLMLTFSNHPTMLTLKGEDVVSHLEQLRHADMGYSTNIEAGFQAVLRHAIQHNLSAEDMPEYLAVFSDMEFNQSSAYGSTTFETAKAAFEKAGYKLPQVIWWNIASRGANVPVKFDQAGTALVSGFSPAIAKNIMSGQNVDPYSMMLRTIMDERYDIPELVKKIV